MNDNDELVLRRPLHNLLAIKNVGFTKKEINGKKKIHTYKNGDKVNNFFFLYQIPVLCMPKAKMEISQRSIIHWR